MRAPCGDGQRLVAHDGSRPVAQDGSRMGMQAGSRMDTHAQPMTAQGGMQLAGVERWGYRVDLGHAQTTGYA